MLIKEYTEAQERFNMGERDIGREIRTIVERIGKFSVRVIIGVDNKRYRSIKVFCSPSESTGKVHFFEIIIIIPANWCGVISKAASDAPMVQA